MIQQLAQQNSAFDMSIFQPLPPPPPPLSPTSPEIVARRASPRLRTAVIADAEHNLLRPAGVPVSRSASHASSTALACSGRRGMSSMASTTSR
ncbi:hypothetical protein GUJ93_ZPchr0005g14479 [Zizania palustris]|uniref:Uncharacterized protein n=1 Tax=Zizania palustris TaxID=103762 RepID=A0A8J5W0D8_ZIZPA|nr:hypothetical protein GUJ93_ZPchr0005g14479 [Zizania palustris]